MTERKSTQRRLTFVLLHDRDQTDALQQHGYRPSRGVNDRSFLNNTQPNNILPIRLKKSQPNCPLHQVITDNGFCSRRCRGSVLCQFWWGVWSRPMVAASCWPGVRTILGDNCRYCSFWCGCRWLTYCRRHTVVEGSFGRNTHTHKARQISILLLQRASFWGCGRR